MVTTDLAPLRFSGPDGQTHSYIPPANKQELQQYLQLLFGLTVPATAVCPGHSAPLDAIASSYFAEAPINVWKASRGFGGKTKLLSSLAHLELMLGANVVLLGGSGQQSQRIHDSSREAWNYRPVVNGVEHESPFKAIIPQEPSSWKTNTTYNTTMTALRASPQAVRGLHPERLRLDEADEIAEDIFDASLGQPMDNPQKGIMSQITISSTHQYADGMMTEVLKRAGDLGWPVFEWCYRESLESNGGWLSDEQVAKKRALIPAYMWDTEYELQEPSSEDRIFDKEDVDFLFSLGGATEVGMGRAYVFEAPERGAAYVTGCDWGKDKHQCVILTLRTDVKPVRLVAWACYQHVSYPRLVQYFDARLRRFPGVGVHDAIGVGNAAADSIQTRDVIHYKTRSKEELYSKLIFAIQEGGLVSPYIAALHSQIRYLKNSDVYGRTHPPDGVSSLALAWVAVNEAARTMQRPGRMLEAFAL